MAQAHDEWPGPENTWRVCINCSCYEPFEGQTDECCRTESGVACIYAPQGSSVGQPLRWRRARGPPQGSRSRSRNRIPNHDSLARAAHKAAERAADRAGAAAREAEGAAALAAEAAAEARAAAGAARIHASVALAARIAAAAPTRRLAPGRVGEWGQVTVTTPEGDEWAVTRPSSRQPPA